MPRRDVEVRCADCMVPFTWSVGEQQYFEARNFQPPRRCAACRNHRKSESTSANDVPLTDRTLTCRDCGEPFVFPALDQHQYQARGYVVPSRCLACRGAARARREQHAQEGSP